MCEGCKLFTIHSYAGTQAIGIHTVDVLYECTRCGEHRVYGREHTGEVPQNNDDADDADLNSAA